jgi:hypothetical protein
MMIIRLIALVFMLVVAVFALRRLADGFGEMGKKASEFEAFRYAHVLDEPGTPPATLVPVGAQAASRAPSPSAPVEAPGPTAPSLSAAAAQACLAGAKPEAPCLQALATWDRPAANAAAKGLVDKPGPLGVLARSLVAYADRTALEAAMAGSGCERPSSTGDALTLLDLLEGTPCIHGFDPETGRSPNRHDELLRTLADLGGRELRAPVEVLFEESPPPNDVAPYALRAWADGRRYTAQAQNLGDWYDVDAVLGLLNEVARRLGKAQRWVMVSADGNYAEVVSANGPWLQDVIRRGLLPVESGSERIAEAMGHEQVVLERLEAGSGDAGSSP